MPFLVKNGFALVRPPGHHATKDAASGYCIFNNAAQAVQAAFNFGTEKILLVDLDVHHGQATQKLFYDDDRVLVFSIHRYQNGSFWPYLKESNFNYIGEGKGRGFNVNVPLNELHCTDSDYSAIFWHVLWPIANEYSPDFVIISAGFDSIVGDPLGEMDLSPEFYGHLIHHLNIFANGKLMLLLEGGYNRKMLPICVENCLRVLLGETPKMVSKIGAAKNSTTESILNVIGYLRKYWHCFDFYGINSFAYDWPKHQTKLEFLPPDENYDDNSLNQHILREPTKRELLFEETNAKKTALYYNDLMEKHFDEIGPHPECPQRISKIFSHLTNVELVDRCQLLDCRKATDSQLEWIHDSVHVENMRKTANFNELQRRNEEYRWNSVFINKHTFECALLAVGGIVQCVDCVLSGTSPNALALVRPPGHHAIRAVPFGFCIFNNVAIGVKYAIEHYKMSRILVLDWDVHHGNGIQDAFYEDPNVLYISLHRYENGAFFPANREGNWDFSGRSAGLGLNVNIPWSGSRMTDNEYLAAFSMLVMPIAYEFSPELVLISAGFDAALGDPLGDYKLSPNCFAIMTSMLAALAGGRVVLALEGGYNLASISNSTESCLRTLLGDSIPHVERQSSKVYQDAWMTIRNVAIEQSRYWSCFSGLIKVIPCDKKPTIDELEGANLVQQMNLLDLSPENEK